MMTGRPAVPGSALWFLPHLTSAGMHTAPLTFSASTPGTYHNLCPVPGHAQKGMAGTLIVSRAVRIMRKPACRGRARTVPPPPGREAALCAAVI